MMLAVPHRPERRHAHTRNAALGGCARRREHRCLRTGAIPGPSGDYARAHPGAVKFGSSGVGTPVHLAGELMMQLTGISMVHVPYKGIAPAMGAILTCRPPRKPVCIAVGVRVE